MATPTCSLIFVSALLVCAGRDRHARAQFIKGGSVKGSVKGGESGSALFYKGALGSNGFSDGSGSKSSFSAQAFSGGTKGGVALSKGSFSSFGTKGLGVQQSSALQGLKVPDYSQQQGSLKSGGAFGSLSQTYQFSGQKNIGAGIGLKGVQESQLTKGFVKGGFGSGQFQPYTGMKGVKDSSWLKGGQSQLTKGFVKGAGVSYSNQVPQLFGAKGVVGNRGVKVSEVRTSWSNGPSLVGVKLGQGNSAPLGAPWSSGVKGTFASQDGTKGLIKGSAFGNLVQSQGGLKSQGTKGNSLGLLRIGQQSGGIKGEFVNGGGFGIGGGAQQSLSSTSFLNGNGRYAYRHSASHYGSVSSRTQHRQHSFYGHQGNFGSFKAKQVVKGAPYQSPLGQQKGGQQQSFSAQMWGSKQGSGMSKGLLAGYQQQQSGGGATLFSAKQQQQQLGQQKISFDGFKTKVATSQQTIKSAPQLRIQQASGQSLRVQQQQSAAAPRPIIKSAPLQQVQTAVGQSQQKISLGGLNIQQKAAPQQTVRIDPLQNVQRVVGQAQQKLPLQGLQVQAQLKASPQQSIKIGPQQQARNVIGQSLQSAQQQQSSQVAIKSPFRLGTFGSGSMQQSVNGILPQQQQQKG